MTTRVVSPGRGWSWFRQAINLGRNNPKAVFGAVALMLGGSFWFGLSRSAPPGTVYVPAELQGERIAPGHTEPHR